MLNTPSAAILETSSAETGFAEAGSDGQAQRISFEEFLAEQHEDDFKYEWVDGQIIKTERTMNPEQLYILYNLRRKFHQTDAFKKELGTLESEFGAKLPTGNYRRPDIGYLTQAQIFEAKTLKAPLLPAFAVEIISGNEKTEETQEKLDDYLSAGIQVVWHIFPNLKTVRVYYPDGGSKYCSKSDAVCSAAPALPDFEMTISEIFQEKP